LDLFEIQHELIADRTPDTWYRLRPQGPAFHYRWDHGTRHDKAAGELVEYSTVNGEHHEHAVCRDEVMSPRHVSVRKPALRHEAGVGLVRQGL